LRKLIRNEMKALLMGSWPKVIVHRGKQAFAVKADQ